MERSSEFGIRCECGHLNQPTKQTFCVCAKCGETFPFRIEQRTFYVAGKSEGPRHCTCDFCEGRMTVDEIADFYSLNDGGD